MKLNKENRGITLVALIVTIIILLIMAGIAIAQLTGSGILEKAKLAKNKYEISEAKEKLELKIIELRIEEEGKGENLTKEDLPKLNNDEIDVGSTESFPVEVICGKYKFNVNENFIVTYVGEANETIMTYTTTPEGYTNQDEIQILIKVSNPKGIKTIEYPDGYVLELNGATEKEIDYSVTANGIYTFKVIDSENNEVIKDLIIDQIDKLAPLDFTISYEKTENGIKVIGETQDSDSDEVSTKSGIDYYEYWLIHSSGEKTKYNKTEIEIKAGGKYQLYAITYDRAGNKRISNTIEIQIIKTTQIAAGSYHSLAIDSEGNLRSWGRNDNGQLGDGTTTNSVIPIQIKAGTNFRSISAGASHSLAIDSEGNLWLWGNNEYGQLGNGTITNSTIPIQIKEGTKFNQIAAGGSHSLAIDENGNLWTWGFNKFGQLGDGTTTNSVIPIQIKAGTNFRSISAGICHSLVIDENGNLWAWGSNNSGQLGNGTSGTFAVSTVPVQIKSETKFSQISAGGSHSLAIDESGYLWAWGLNHLGQLGNGTTTDNTRPIQIKVETKFSQVSAKASSSSAIDSEGNLWTWGYNGYGQLGNGTTTESLIPIKITY